MIGVSEISVLHIFQTMGKLVFIVKSSKKIRSTWKND